MQHNKHELHQVKGSGRARTLGVLCGALFGLTVAGCSQSSPHSTARVSEQAPAPRRVTLTEGDAIKIIFTGAPELNQAQKIRADGKISLPQIGEISAAGKTLPQLQAEIIALYKPQLKNSDVLVTLESATTHIFVSGAVNHGGPVTIDRPTTILQAIMQAGGPNQFANLGRVQIISLTNGREQSQVIDLRPTLAGQDTRPTYVRDGDVIRVPQSAF